MKFLHAMLCLGLLSTGVRAQAPHPSVLTVSYKGQMLPVARVIGTDPVVVVGGAEKRIRTAPTYLLQRVAGFGDESVEFLRVSMGGMELKMVADLANEGASAPSTGPRFGTSYFEATLKSKNTLKGAFAAVVVYSAGNLVGEPSKHNQSEIIVHELPELPAGQAVPVKFSSAIPNGGKDQKYFVQIFDGAGHEVTTNRMESGWAYYRLREGVQLDLAIEKYRRQFAGADHAAVPVMMAKPLIRDRSALPEKLITAVLTVSPAGLVTDLALDRIENAGVRGEISRALHGWLFLPRLKAGEPVASKVQVPIEF